MRYLTARLIRPFLALSLALNGIPSFTTLGHADQAARHMSGSFLANQAFAVRPASIRIRTLKDPFIRLAQWLKSDWGYRQWSNSMGMSFGLSPFGGESKAHDSPKRRKLRVLILDQTNDRPYTLGLLRRLPFLYDVSAVEIIEAEDEVAAQRAWNGSADHPFDLAVLSGPSDVSIALSLRSSGPQQGHDAPIFLISKATELDSNARSRLALEELEKVPFDERGFYYQLESALDLAPLPSEGNKASGEFRVLVVDDSSIYRNIDIAAVIDAAMTLGWKPQQIVIDTADDGLSGLAQVRNAWKANAPYHLIVTDFSMPSMSGDDLTKAVRQEEAAKGHQQVPIFIVTNTPGSEEPRENTFLNAGASAVLKKPRIGLYQPYQPLVDLITPVMVADRGQNDTDVIRKKTIIESHILEHEVLSALLSAEWLIKAAIPKNPDGSALDLAADSRLNEHLTIRRALSKIFGPTRALSLTSRTSDEAGKVLARVMAALSEHLRNFEPTYTEAVERLDHIDPALRITAGRLYRFVQRRLLSFVKSRGNFDLTGEPILVDVEDSLLTVIAYLGQGRVGDRLAIDVNIEASLPPVRIDQDLLFEVWDNLLRNAAEAAMRSGVVMRISAKRDGNAVVVQFNDQGPGVATEIREQIFERGFTTKQSGHGVGLWLVREIIQKAGGSVEIESLTEREYAATNFPSKGFPGSRRRTTVGTTFTIRLPIADNDSSDPLRSQPLPALQPHSPVIDAAA